jgi:L-lactate permease
MLDYVALVMLIAIAALVVYGLVAVWGIPYEIAKARRHPHEDAIGAATWVSLGTLGALWPFLWIWAMAYRPDRGWGLSKGTSGSELAAKIALLESRLTALERPSGDR